MNQGRQIAVKKNYYIWEPFLHFDEQNLQTDTQMHQILRGHCSKTGNSFISKHTNLEPTNHRAPLQRRKQKIRKGDARASSSIHFIKVINFILF